MKKINSKMLVLMTLIIGAGSAYAQDNRVVQTTADNKGYVGFVGGASSLNNNNADVRAKPSVGVTLGAKMDEHVGIGFFGNYFGQTASGGTLGLPDGTDTDIFVTTGQLNLWFNNLHVGGEAGAQFNTWTGTSTAAAGNSTTDFVYGPEAGYDYKVSKVVSLGAELHYLFNNTASSRDNMQALAALKFWM